MMRYQVLLLGPDRQAVSGVSTHLNQLFNSPLAAEWQFGHFQVGSEGRTEQAWQKAARIVLSPFSLAWQILRHQPAILHLNTSLDWKSFWRDAAYLFVGKILGLRVVWQVHGGALPQVFCRNQVMLRRLLRGVLKLPDAIVVLAACELAAYQDFLPQQKVTLIPNAVNLEAIRDISASAAQADGALQLIYLGRLSREKGIDTVLSAVAHLHAQGRNIHLAIAGSGPLEPFLRDQVQALHLQHVVQFVGVVAGAAKQEALAAADIFVFPTHREGLPYSLLEAMAAGTPVITTRVGAIPDVVEEGVHGWFVPPRETGDLVAILDRLAENKALLSGMGQACRQRVAQFYTIERLAERFHEVYAMLAPAHTHRRKRQQGARYSRCLRPEGATNDKK